MESKSECNHADTEHRPEAEHDPESQTERDFETEDDEAEIPTRQLAALNATNKQSLQLIGEAKRALQWKPKVLAATSPTTHPTTNRSPFQMVTSTNAISTLR